MKIRVAHFSDWHGLSFPLPDADLYLATGDMCPNSLGHRMNWLLEEKFQKRFMHYSPIYIPKIYGQVSEVFCVRGNHDHVDIAPLFVADKVYEFKPGTNVITWKHGDKEIKIGGFRGVKRLHGRGPDEMFPEAYEKHVHSFHQHKVDILLTHGAPYGVRDGEGSEMTGSPALLAYLKFFQPKLHCFGHIHEAKGISKVGETICSNAATGINEITLEL